MLESELQHSQTSLFANMINMVMMINIDPLQFTVGPLEQAHI